MQILETNDVLKIQPSQGMMVLIMGVLVVCVFLSIIATSLGLTLLNDNRKKTRITGGIFTFIGVLSAIIWISAGIYGTNPENNVVQYTAFITDESIIAEKGYVVVKQLDDDQYVLEKASARESDESKK